MSSAGKSLSTAGPDYFDPARYDEKTDARVPAHCHPTSSLTANDAETGYVRIISAGDDEHLPTTNFDACIYEVESVLLGFRQTLPLWRRKCHKVAPALRVGSSRVMLPLPTTHTSSTSSYRTTRADLWKSPRSNRAIACWTSRAALVL